MKWKILNGVAILLLLVSTVAGSYSFLYPAPFEPELLIKQVAWNRFCLIYLAILLGSAIFSIGISRKSHIAGTFLITTFFLQAIAVMIIGVSGAIAFINKRSEVKELFSELEKQAARDIRADSIRYISYGLPIPDSNDLKRDSIMAKYGIYHTPICTIDPIFELRDLYYERLTQAYLNKRNGKNWKLKMQKELAPYKAN